MRNFSRTALFEILSCVFGLFDGLAGYEGKYLAFFITSAASLVSIRHNRPVGADPGVGGAYFRKGPCGPSNYPIASLARFGTRRRLT